jgi:putative FmdB family regulatory protein
MPLYDYRCLACGSTFELLRSLREAEEKLTCPNCHSEQVERLLSTFATGGCAGSGPSRFT